MELLRCVYEEKKPFFVKKWHTIPLSIYGWRTHALAFFICCVISFVGVLKCNWRNEYQILTICHGIWLLKHSVRALWLRGVEASVGHAWEGRRVLVSLHGGRGLRTVLATTRYCVVITGRGRDGRSFSAALTRVVRGAKASSPRLLWW